MPLSRITTNSIPPTLNISSNVNFTSSANLSNANFANTITIGSQASSFAFRNKIINGSMQVAQRNGTSSTTMTATSSDLTLYTDVDRFRTAVRNASVITQQSTEVPTGQGFNFSKKLTVNTVSSNTTHNYTEIVYGMEGLDVHNMAWDYTDPNSFITVSFWARSSVAGTYPFQVRNPPEQSEGAFTSYYTLPANTWTRVVSTIPGNSAWVRGVNILNAPIAELVLIFSLDAGTAYTDSTRSPANTWFNVTDSSGMNYYADYPQRWTTVAGATFNLTGVQLEVGRTATPFEFKPFREELRDCMRYYQKSRPYETRERASYGNGYPFQNQGVILTSIASDDGAAGFSIEFPVEMRAAPTVYTVVPDGTVSTSVRYPVYNASGFGIGTGEGPNSSSRRIVTYSNGLVNRAEELCFVYFVDAEI